MWTRISLLLCFYCGVAPVLLAQNWSPLLPDRTYHFQSEGGYFVDQTVRVDSTYQQGASGWWVLNRVVQPCDSCWISGSIWVDQPVLLGAEVEMTSEGYYRFFEPDDWEIRPQAEVGDSWMFASGLQATVTDLSEQEVLGQLDSVKTISLSSGDSLLLSKNFGMILLQGMPPYDQQYYELVGIEAPDMGIQVPGFGDFFNFEVGDVFQYRRESHFVGELWKTLEKRTILSKAMTPDSLVYTTRRVRLETYFQFGVPYDSTSTVDTVDWVFARSDWGWTDGFHRQLVTGNFHPEIGGDNSTYITLENIGGQVNKHLGNTQIGDLNTGIYSPSAGDSLLYEPSFAADSYYHFVKEGLGTTNSYFWIFEVIESLELIGQVKGGDTIGTVYPDGALILSNITSPITPKWEVSLFPNPVEDEVELQWQDPLRQEGTLLLIGQSGGVIEAWSVEAGTRTFVFSLGHLPAGYYQLACYTDRGRSIKPVIKK